MFPRQTSFFSNFLKSERGSGLLIFVMFVIQDGFGVDRQRSAFYAVIGNHPVPRQGRACGVAKRNARSTFRFSFFLHNQP
jgi:hypothetical protein